MLLPATDLNEWAALSACSILRGAGPLPLEPHRTQLAAAIESRKNPLLLALDAEARRRHLPCVWDDESVTLGAGATSMTWPLAGLPAASAVPWEGLRTQPLALVTGTNGKTTSVRLLARILKHAGHVVGMTTTDGVWIDEQEVLSGDYTGPAGATEVLRRKDIDAAVLETARGGILRRGLVVRSANVALLTNVSDDHLGQYGIDDFSTLARVKAVVGRVVPASGRVVVNADDPYLMAESSSFAAPLSLFSLDWESPILGAHVAKGGEGWTVKRGSIVRVSRDEEREVASVRDVPVAFGGAAPYNVANALGAAASARVLGVSDAVIHDGLGCFAPSARDNPGRGNLVDVRGVSVLVDFAHNPAGIRSVLQLALHLRAPGGRLLVIGGYAGDRSDESIRDAARAIFDAGPARVILRDLDGYLRGRAAGEVPALFRAELTRLGLPAAAVSVAASEADALREALLSAVPGDFVLLLAHLDAAGVAAVIAGQTSR